MFLNAKGRFLPVIVVLILTLVACGVYYLRIQSNNPINPEGSVNQINRVQRINLQEGYYFDVTIPEGYTLKPGMGDYANFIADADGKELIGFQKSSGGGELSMTSPIIIDNVPLVIMYRKDIGCPADIFSEKAHNPQKMYFGILTWCQDERAIQLPVYKQVIDSIVFGDKLRDVILGNSPAPSIQ